MEVPTQPEGGALALDSEIQEELSAAFPGPSPMAKITSSLSPYKMSNDLYMALFRAPKAEEEMIIAVGSTFPLSINPNV